MNKRLIELGRAIGPLRNVYRLVRRLRSSENVGKLKEFGFALVLMAVYYLLVTPYGVMRRLLFRKSLYRARSGWIANPQSTMDRELFDKLV